MNYSKGRKGPESRLQLEIRTIYSNQDGPNGMARGDGLATLSGGRFKGIDFMAQGKHRAKLAPFLKVGETIDVTVRWTGGMAVTVTEVHLPAVAKAA